MRMISMMWRVPRMWYGLTVIIVMRRLKLVTRNVGEKMKVYGRKLEKLGDDETPRWSRELFYRCYLVETEVHLAGKVYCGRIDSIYLKHSGKKRILVVVFKKPMIQDGRSIPVQSPGFVKVKLFGYGEPIVIKEHGYDCVWAGCDDGHLAVYFLKPENHRCFN